MNKRSKFLSLGLEYFILARNSVFIGLQTICGVMYHHAFELLLKSHFEKDHTTQQLKDDFGHKLKKLWKEFKKKFHHENLSRFDELIVDIDRWEGIRYLDFPKEISALAFTTHFNRDDMEKVKKNMVKLRKNGQELYSFMFDDADELFSVILRLSPIKPEYAKSMLIKKEAQKIYLNQNKFPYWE